MMKLLAVLAVLALPAQAAPSLEAAHAAAGAFEAPVPVKAFKAQRNVSLSGDARLSGTGWVPQNGGFVTVFLNGSVQVSGDGGRVQGNGPVNQSVSVWVQNHTNYVSQFVTVNTSVSLYENGRYVGTASVYGSFMVSGWANGGFLRLDGNGSVNGSAFISDPAAKN